MTNGTETPFGAALAFQRGAIRQGQRTVEQGMDAQRAMTEAFVRNSIGMGRTVNRTGVEATRQGMTTFAGMMDVLFPGGASTRASVDEGFDSVADAQDTAWRVVEENAEDALAAYADMAESQKDLFAESVSTTLEAHGRVGRRSSDAAVEYERQSPERTAHRERGEQADAREVTPDQPSEPRRTEIEAEESAPADASDTVDTAPESETATEPEVEAPDRAEPPTAGTGGPSLDDISGVGMAYARRLEDAGIETVEQLRDADAAELSEETEISDERVENWQKQARHLLESEEE